MPIQIDLEKKIFLCSTDKMSYAFGIAENGLPVNLHWGGKIEDSNQNGGRKSRVKSLFHRKAVPSRPSL